jgi:hypothetical protein
LNCLTGLGIVLPLLISDNMTYIIDKIQPNSTKAFCYISYEMKCAE